jgi:hypothetical protein
MQTKHTPGPWHTFRQGTKHFVSQATDEDFRFAIAVVYESTYHPEGALALRQEATANARLIAAAPDLLAALQAIMGDPDAVDHILHLDAVAADAAIAKATGGEA